MGEKPTEDRVQQMRDAVLTLTSEGTTHFSRVGYNFDTFADELDRVRLKRQQGDTRFIVLLRRAGAEHPVAKFGTGELHFETVAQFDGTKATIYRPGRWEEFLIAEAAEARPVMGGGGEKPAVPPIPGGFEPVDDSHLF
jgi:hypothetical protein